MRRSDRKCWDLADNVPGGLRIESFVKTEEGSCAIKVREEASHVVAVENRTLLRFTVNVAAETESESLYYGDHEKTWGTEVEIGHRPLNGGSRKRSIERGLTSAEPSVDSGVKMTIKYTAVGCMCEGVSVIQLQVDTPESDDDAS
jgi:hypothetical protein